MNAAVLYETKPYYFNYWVHLPLLQYRDRLIELAKISSGDGLDGILDEIEEIEYSLGWRVE